MATRLPVVSGLFYPGTKGILLKQLRDMFSKTRKPREGCRAVICPHAGYEYSGSMAAKAVSQLTPANHFIVLGPNHYLRGGDFAIMSSGSWETPLGRVPIDSSLARRLLKHRPFREDPQAHEREHSIEAVLPFLQHRFKGLSFVPISVMNVSYSQGFLRDCEAAGKAIASAIRGKNIGVVVSSDFSHYLPEKAALEKDKKAIKQIKRLDLDGFFRALDETEASVCGYGPIAVLMSMARELGLKPRAIGSTTSAEAGGDRGSVVSYHAIGFYQ
jgi:AmmeMemoRadiSam system protein B